MEYFNKLPGFIQSPSGLEWKILKKIPLLLLISGILPGLVIFKLYLTTETLKADQLKVIYQCVGIIFSFWFFIGVVTIGCVVIIIMKGPAYVADPYELPQENKELEPN